MLTYNLSINIKNYCEYHSTDWDNEMVHNFSESSNKMVSNNGKELNDAKRLRIVLSHQQLYSQFSFKVDLHSMHNANG